MILKIRSRVRNIALVLAIFSFLLSSRAFILEEEEQVRSCDEAFNLCLSSNPFPITFPAYYGFIIHCSAGYIFCKKYIEKF